MQHTIAVLRTNLTLSSLAPTPTPRSILPSPVPTTTIHYLPVDAGNGLNGVFFVLLVLVLAGIAGWVIWMFGTGRWLSLKAGQAYAASENTRQRPVSQASIPTPAALGRRGTPPGAGPDIGPVGQGLSQSEDPLNNKRWIELAEGCAALFDELDGRFPPSDARYEITNRTLHRLQVVLRRSGVEVLARDRVYDPTRHQLVPPDPVVPPGVPIARIVSPGFAIGNQVLRPAKVEVARPDDQVDQEP